MAEFLEALSRYHFLQYALLAGLLASLSCGVVGTLVVVRRISYLAGAIAHAVLAGLGAARYLQVVHGLTWAEPMAGAVVVGLVAAVVMGLVSLRAGEREDTIIGAIWAVGMAAGVLFMAATPGYGTDLMSYLFGNILMVSGSDLWLMVILDILVVAVVGFLYQRLLAVCFDEEFARLRGIRVELLFILMLCLTALTVVLLSAVVGIVMVIALLTLPAAMAGRLFGRLWRIMIGAVGICMLLTSGGLALSYSLDLPSGSVIIVLAGAAYLTVTLLARLFPAKA